MELYNFSINIKCVLFIHSFQFQKDYPNALKWYQKALVIFEKVLGKEHPYIVTTTSTIAGVYSSQGDYVKALEWYQKAWVISENRLGSNHPDAQAIRHNIEALGLK